MSSSDKERFGQLILDLASTGHGSKELDEVKAFLADLKRTAKREAFLLPLLLQPAVTWNDAKDAAWRDEETQDKNRFAFLQGDVVGTTAVLALGMAETSQVHDLWLVLAPDCDCVRAEYVRVAAVFPVRRGDKDPKSVNALRFGHSLKLNSPKAFPLPPLPDGDSDPVVSGYSSPPRTPHDHA